MQKQVTYNLNSHQAKEINSGTEGFIRDPQSQYVIDVPTFYMLGAKQRT